MGRSAHRRRGGKSLRPVDSFPYLFSMIPPPDVEGGPVAARRRVSRQSCPSCGSGKFTQLVIGVPSGRTAATNSSAWVSSVGDIHPGYNRECSICGTTWSANFTAAVDSRQSAAVRVLAQTGDAFALLPVPDLLAVATDSVLVDIELLSPDRLVRYLGRRVRGESLQRLAHAWTRCADDADPEHSVEPVEDHGAGLRLDVVASTVFTVTLEVLVRADVREGTDEWDVLDLDVARSSLIRAAHSLKDWMP